MKGERIRRGGGSGRLSVKDAPRAARQVRKAATRTPLGRTLARLPVSAEAVQRGIAYSLVALALAAVWGVASFFGLPAWPVWSWPKLPRTMAIRSKR
jgi:hypothetical protein